jgi:hypothetical protein
MDGTLESPWEVIVLCQGAEGASQRQQAADETLRQKDRAIGCCADFSHCIAFAILQSQIM